MIQTIWEFSFWSRPVTIPYSHQSKTRLRLGFVTCGRTEHKGEAYTREGGGHSRACKGLMHHVAIHAWHARHRTVVSESAHTR